jgi:hypothetical protein
MSTLTGRGLREPPFAEIVFGPEVQVDLAGPNPPAAARAAVIEELIRRTVEQDEN